MEVFERITNKIAIGFGYIAIGLLLPMMMLIVIDVFARFALDKPIMGLAELTTVMLSGYCLAMAYTGVKKRHILVEELVKRFPPRTRNIISSIMLTGSLAITVIIVKQLFGETYYYFQKMSNISYTLKAPQFIFWGIFTLSWVLIGLILIPMLVKSIGEVFKKCPRN